MAVLNTCPTCGNYNPYAERYPSVKTVRRELQLIRLEKKHQQIQEKKRLRIELGKTMRRDHISRQRWLADFTHRQMLMGERILRESRKNGGTVTD